MSLPHGALPELISPHLKKLIEETGGIDGPIGKQFIANEKLESKYFKKGVRDPLIEDEFEVAPGLVYKYQGKLKEDEVLYYGRALWTICRFCSSYCRFCTRGREVGLPATVSLNKGGAIAKSPYLNDKQIDEVFDFIKKRKELIEIIVSGGDPLVTPKDYLEKIIIGLANLQKNGFLRIIRVGTRVPISNPSLIKDWHYQLLAKIKNPYLMVHINHPKEITSETINVLNNFRKMALATVMSQTVLLKGVNDNEKILSELFLKLTEEGIRPYYVFQNDPVYWAKHFTVPIKKAIKIWQNLRPKLSGIVATARFVIDVPFGFGKIPIPEGRAWEVNYKFYRDFKGNKHPLK